MTQINRRKLAAMAIGSTGILAQAQSTRGVTVTVPPTPELMSFHNEVLTQIRQELAKDDLLTKNGASDILRLLVNLGAISNSDAEKISQIINAIYNGETVPLMIAAIKAAAKRVGAEGSEIVKAVATVANNSADYLSRQTNNKDMKRASYLVAADVIGALNGAVTCAKFPQLIVVGILAGAVAGSGAAWYSSQPKA